MSEEEGHAVLMFCLQIVLQNVLKFSCFPANFCRVEHMNVYLKKIRLNVNFCSLEIYQ
jgi:hypothetical protein